MELTPEICQRLKSVMKKKNITGYTIHKEIGISATTIGNYLNGKIANADNTKIKAICVFLDIDIAWLETGEKNVVCESEEKKVKYTKGSTEDILNQILLVMTAMNEQQSLSRKETRNITDIMSNGFKALNQKVDKLEKKVDRLETENQILKKKQKGNA